MTTIEYDLDLTGGLMDDIRRLVAPPQTERDRSKRPRVQDRQQQQRRPPGKPPNHDCCDSCKEGGDLLCCDRCSAAFHLQCHDPPLDEDDVPTGQWLCRKCCTRPAPSGDSQDDENSSTSSSRSRQSELLATKSRLPSTTNSSKTTPPLRGLVGELDENFTDLEFSADDIAAGSRNPLLLLSAAAKQLNPRQFDLPKDIMCPISFPGSSKFSRRKAGGGPRGAKKSVFEMENGIVPLPAKLCYICGRSCRFGLLIQCDYCPLLFHLDCLNPPLTSLPAGRWMCPNHVEHTLDDRMLTSVRLSERILLWNKFTAPIDPHSVKIDFLHKIHRINPPFRTRSRLQPRTVPLKVPAIIKTMYSRTVRQKQLPQPVSTQSSQDLDTGVVDFDQKQWLKSVARLQSDIVKYLSATNDVPFSSGTKPTASVTPQIKIECSAASPADSASQPVSIFEDEVPVVTSDISADGTLFTMTSKSSPAPNFTVMNRDNLVTVTTSSYPADSEFQQQVDVSASSLTNLSQQHDSFVSDFQEISVVDSHCSAQLLRPTVVDELADEMSVSDVACRNLCFPSSELVNTHAELEAASALCGIEQLAAIAAAAIPESNVLNISTLGLSSLKDTDCDNLVLQQQGLVSDVGSVELNGTMALLNQHQSSPVRAVLYPFSADVEPFAMCKRSMTVGSCFDADVCLSDVGHCNNTSPKHAVIFYDELSHTFELLNYSEFGTTVDGVLYACDVSVATRPPSRRMSARQRQQANAAEVVRQLMAQYPPKDEKNGNQLLNSSGHGKNGHCNPCGCEQFMCGAADNSSGWEGSASLQHGSVIQFGCLKFTFSITEHETSV